MLKIVVDLDAVRSNLLYARSLLRRDARLLFMVKGDAYGHGAGAVVAAVDDLVDCFGVADVGEGVSVRRFTEKPILVSVFDPVFTNEVAEYMLTPLLSCTEQIKETVFRAKWLKKVFPVHLKLNTGMNRLGISDKAELARAVSAVYGSENLKLAGMATHYYSQDRGAVTDQTERFKELALPYKARDGGILLHTSASAGVELSSEFNFDMVRVGIVGYGCSTVGKTLSPALSVKSRILQINELEKEEIAGYSGLFIAEQNVRIGIICGGYFDGVPINRTSVARVSGREVPFVGRTMMDMSMISLAGVNARPGDEVELLSEKLSAARLAEVENTIPYEILTRYRENGRGNRVYVKNGASQGD